MDSPTKVTLPLMVLNTSAKQSNSGLGPEKKNQPASASTSAG